MLLVSASGRQASPEMPKAADPSAAFARDGSITQSTHNALSL